MRKGGLKWSIQTHAKFMFPLYATQHTHPDNPMPQQSKGSVGNHLPITLDNFFDINILQEIQIKI